YSQLAEAAQRTAVIVRQTVVPVLVATFILAAVALDIDVLIDNLRKKYKDKDPFGKLEHCLDTVRDLLKTASEEWTNEDITVDNLYLLFDKAEKALEACLGRPSQ